jgi:hypothetical protein
MTRHRHGLKHHPLYAVWSGARSRCLNKNDPSYPHYGARGITMYSAWVDDPGSFIAWIEENLGPRHEGMSIDRIDNDGNYEPGNLRWATKAEQLRNRSAFGVSGYRGVWRNGNNWKAGLRIDGENVHLGTFDTPEEASAVVEAERRRRGL